MNLKKIFEKKSGLFQELRDRFTGERALREFQDALLPFPLFLLLILCSSVIATFGILRNNIPITIGAMIIAPLVAPVIGISLGTMVHKPKILLKSLGYTISGSLLFIITAGTIKYFYPDVTTNFLLDFLPPHVGVPEASIAFASGIVASLAFASEKVYSRISGAAISLALAPPLALIGFGIVKQETQILWLSCELFAINIFGLVSMSLLIFYWFGFRDIDI